MKNLLAPFNWRAELKNKIVDSIDDDFILLDNPIVNSDFDHPFKMDVTVAIICVRGTMKGSINLKQFDAKAPFLFIVLQDQILEYEYFSEDFSGLFILMSGRFLTNLSLDIQSRVPLFISVHDNPWIPLNDEELRSMVDYYKMLQKAVSARDNPHRLEIVKHLTQAFFYGTGYQYHKLPGDGIKSKQEILLEKFLNLLQANYKEHRDMEFYAGRMCLTPKYLSKVIKEKSSKSASEWIDNYVTLEARALLKSTNMTIRQISDELNFPSQSFFGKYFKRHQGMSPKEYRKN